MGVEIERKFLVHHDKWSQIQKPAGTHYRQGYVLNDDKRTIRVRTTDKAGYITFKGASSGISRSEFEYTIPVEDGIQLLDGFATSEVEKVRYCIDFEGNTWEVDEFLGDNAGLITAEIELDHEEQTFTKPNWVAAEVSDQAKYYNSSLSTHPFKDWGK
jgi:adenylate cyclase